MEFQPFIKLLCFCKLITHEALRSLNAFMYSGWNWKLEVLVFEERGKAKYLKKIVTSHAKTYTNGFVLNGQKPTANQRVPNGFSNGFNGFLNAFNGCAKTFNGL